MTTDTTFERELLGAALYEPRLLDEWTVGPDDFADPKHREIARTMRAMQASLERIDPLTVHEALAHRGLGEAVPQAYMLELQAVCLTADPAPTRVYSAKVLEASIGRWLRSETGRVAHELGLGSMSNQEAVEALQRAAGQALDRLTRQDRYSALPAVTKALWTELEHRTTAEQTTGLSTGFPDLDACIGGLRPGVVTVLGGRTSTGKSAFARSLADNLSTAGHGVHYFTLEDTGLMLAERQLADTARIDLADLASPKGRITQGHMAKLAMAANKMRARTNWGIEDQPTMSSGSIAASTRRRKGELGTKVVVVDYVQLVRERGDNPRERINTALLGLLKLAREEQIALLLLSQVGRDQEKESRPPRLSDLKESGAIEEQASCVLLLHRDKESAGVIVAKNKHGARDVFVDLDWHGPTATYRPKRSVMGYAL